MAAAKALTMKKKAQPEPQAEAAGPQESSVSSENKPPTQAEVAHDVDIEDVEVSDLKVTEVKAAVRRKAPATKAGSTVDLAGDVASGEHCIEDDADDEVLCEQASVGVTDGPRPGRLRRGRARARPTPGADITLVESGSESSSSGSSSRSRSQRRNKCVGAAAAAALMTAQAPLDVDEADRLIDQQIKLPTKFAARLQHEGGFVAIMADLQVNISVTPSDDGMQDSVVSVSGTDIAVGRAVEQIEGQFRSFSEEQKQTEAAAARQHMAKVEIPSQFLSAAVGPNGGDLPKVREKHGGIMIALMPPQEAGGPLTVHIGPGMRQQVEGAESELYGRLERAMKGEEPKQSEPDEQEKKQQLADEFEALMQDVEG
eukprot:TRINITY_DN30780_c0_g1_i1.p1 TRINITY_DN30780_c0_g1~~TRINITY_DN30780_c0_g1_i1.p1  ORF type:complete len:391 (+),score=115.33 TRINITY_DN30780_c0_g1_i1:61-1173(+)